MKTKFIQVKDTGTDMTFLVVQFEEADMKHLRPLGWGLRQPEGTTPKLIAALLGGGGAAAVISHFDYPPSDINKQSWKMGINHTTVCFAELVGKNDIEALPSLIDVSRMEFRE